MKLNKQEKLLKFSQPPAAKEKEGSNPYNFFSSLIYVPFRPRPFRPLTFQFSVYRFFFNNVALQDFAFRFLRLRFWILM